MGSTTLILSAFTALLNCAEVGRQNRILTNDRFLSHSLDDYCSNAESDSSVVDSADPSETGRTVLTAPNSKVR